MKCPLIVAARASQHLTRETSDSDCLKEECACFDDTRNCCSEITEADALEGIMIALQQIAEKMPYPPAPKH